MTTDKGILIKNIYYMLTYAFQELRQNNYAQIEGEPFKEIHELFTEILIRGVSFLLKQGLHRDYIHQSESLNTIRGKIDLNETIALKSRNSNVVACNYDELSENNILNQIIVTTSEKLLKCKDVKRESRARLRKLMVFFSGVQTISASSIHWNMIRFNRGNHSYRMLVNICHFILDGMLMTTEDGKFRMREFSDKYMNRLFEKFVLEYYKRHHSYLKPKASSVEWNIDWEFSDDGILPAMQTDIMLSTKERTLIIDAKYYGHSMQRQFGKSTIHSNNLYQIHTYVTEHDKNHEGSVDGMLLYAKTEEAIIPDGKMKLSQGNVIYFRTLDLNQDFAGISKTLDSLILNI